MTVVKRGDRWGARTWDRGRKAYRWLGTFDTEAEAARAESDASFLVRNSETPTVGQWGRVWLSDYAREARATQQTYRYAVAQITSELGQLRLDELARPEARRLANRWPRNTSRVARTMWGDAVRDGVCEANPWTNLRLETPRGRKDLTALTEPEIAELADAAERVHGDYGPEARAIILTLAYTGVRPGELCALRRADVDFAARRLAVRFNVDSSGREKTPKNGKARVVTIPPPAVDALRQVPAVIGSDYLFHTLRGKRLTKNTLAYLWRPVATAWHEHSGRPITPYHLRHACATLLIERGVTSGDVAVQLGHSDGGRLVQVLYGHPEQERSLDRVDMAFPVEMRRRAERRSA